jgi:hypothetical protein
MSACDPFRTFLRLGSVEVAAVLFELRLDPRFDVIAEDFQILDVRVLDGKPREEFLNSAPSSGWLEKFIGVSSGVSRGLSA